MPGSSATMDPPPDYGEASSSSLKNLQHLE
jgi:hypothetical protein